MRKLKKYLRTQLQKDVSAFAELTIGVTLGAIGFYVVTMLVLITSNPL